MFTAPPALHVTNLAGLIWLREECRHDLGHAAYLFDIVEEEARFYLELPDSAIDALCTELDLSLFVPRFDSRALVALVAESRDVSGGLRASHLELHNLAGLEALSDACRRSTADAVWIYRINRQTAEAYRALRHRDAVAICSLLAVSAVVPRYDRHDITRILDKPAGSRAMFAAAYEPDIAEPDDARLGIQLTH
ncbi:hypothetical protein BURC_03419 [Burkholderiaceae bacterium]|nr:hypothetical protein BURC_03419 [Burkholderiaceae bacterium]